MRWIQGIAVRLIIAIVVSKPERAEAFTGLVGYRHHQVRKKFETKSNEKAYFRFHNRNHDPETRLFMNIDDDSMTDSSSDDSKRHAIAKTPAQGRRIGGRRRNVRKISEKSSILITSATNIMRNILGKHRKVILWLASAVLVCLFSLGRLFGSTGPTPNYVYYQSSVIERRVIGPDGNIETSRKESFQSNLPELVRLQQQQRPQNTLDAKKMNEAELRRIDEQFRQSNEQMSRSLDRLLDAERKFLLDDFF